MTTLRNYSFLLGFLLVLGGCTPVRPDGIYYAMGEGSVTPDGLHLLDWEPFKVTYVKPGADLARYQKVLVKEVTVSYKTPPLPGRPRTSAVHPNYALSDSGMQSMKEHFHDEFVRALGESENFSVTDTPGPDVLVVAGHIVDLRIEVPSSQDQSPDETVLTSSAGQIKLILDARDSQSGEALVRVGQASAIQMADGGWYESDPVNNSSAVRQIFARWAQALRSELDQFHSLAELPPTPGSTSTAP